MGMNADFGSPEPPNAPKGANLNVSPIGSFVGIFWAVRHKKSAPTLVEHRCSLKEAELYGRMLTCAHGHYDVWEGWQSGSRPVRTGFASLVGASEYEEWPRGRVVYHPDNQRFILYADAQILRRPCLIKVIHETFGLPPDRTLTKADGHYQSTRRLFDRAKTPERRGIFSDNLIERNFNG